MKRFLVTSFLCHMDNLPHYWYYWLMMQIVGQNLIVTAVTASSVRAGQSSRHEHHRVDAGEPGCSYRLVASKCFWKQSSISQLVGCGIWKWTRCIYSGCQEKWKGHYYKSFYDIKQTEFLHTALPLKPSSCEPVASKEYFRFFSICFYSDCYKKCKTVLGKNLSSMNTLTWSLCSGTEVFASDIESSQTSSALGHPCWNQWQKHARSCH